MSRFIKIERREMLPPACSLFERHADDQQFYLDPQLQIDEGAVYISQREFEDMANTVGWVSPERFHKLLNAYKDLVDDHNGLLSVVTAIRTSTNQLSSNLEALKGIELATEGSPGNSTPKQSGTAKPATKP